MLGQDNYNPSAFPSSVQGSSTGGLEGSWNGDEFTISWIIEHDLSTDTWTYSYTFSSYSMAPSAFILEFSNTGNEEYDRSSISDLVINEASAEVGGSKDEFGTWTMNGLVELVNPIYGHKFEVTGGDPVMTTIRFTSDRAPFWGNFHVMGAVNNNAYNMGLGASSSTNAVAFVARPGGQGNGQACPDGDGDGYAVCAGACNPGGLLCGDCNDGDPLINAGALEICSDNVDNDCDQKKDSHDPEGCCAPTGVPEDICNGIDDNCNGSTDEDYVATSTTCGQGECSGSTGQLECQAGVEVDTCDPLAGAAADDSLCNGLDDDCDGQTDEDYTVTPTTCGQGECAGNTGQMECQGGSEVDTCDPLAGATAEACNGIDDDCDGTVDDNPTDAGGTCSAGEGACQVNGTEVCNAGVLECSAVAGTPTAEVCNGIDDDCDGTVDDNPTDAGGACTAGTGACLVNGTEVCNAGVLECSAVAGTPTAEVCNGIDDDCDGTVDDNPTDTGGTCSAGEGACQVNGTEVCNAGVLECSAVAGLPTAEVCNGIDDNCDGTIDDNPTDAGGACSAGTGACLVNGTEVCNAGVLECSAVAGLPTAEVCNGIDDNCDGTVDEDLTQPTSCGTGACAGNTGIETCNAGIWGNDTCDPFAGAAVDDTVCNGLDDDCDGMIDEDYVVDDTCGTGVCRTNNIPSSCTGGVETLCQQGVPDEISEATCSDGLDNDCDGQTDTVDGDCLEACMPPPVRQEIGIQDELYANLVEADCRFCHENPLQFPVLDVSVNDRHHLLVDTVISDPTDAPFGTPGNAYECFSCHEVDESTGSIIFIVERDCLVCHVQGVSEPTVHHRTDLAQGNVPQGPDCQACHGDIVDNRDDGHFIPDFTPMPETPNRSGGTGIPINCRGDGAGACDYCHDDGISGEGIPIETSMTTHHNTGFGSDAAKCDWCHDFTLPLDAQIRICENCHGYISLHNIQADSNGDNVINPGIELPFYGHIGDPDDCWGCHGYSTADLTAPESGTIVPIISSVSDSVLTEGTDTTVTLSGSAFTNMDDGTEVSSEVVLTASDGFSVTLMPDSISQDVISVTIPGTLGKGNYKLKTAKLAKHSNPRVISVIPDVVITGVDCDRKKGILTVSGSDFSEKPVGTDAYINVEVNGQLVDIISWTDTRIRASASVCSNNDAVAVYSLFGSAASIDGKPSKPCRGKRCK